jgi:hypothetical protein
MCQLSRNSEKPVQACKGIALPLLEFGIFFISDILIIGSNEMSVTMIQRIKYSRQVQEDFQHIFVSFLHIPVCSPLCVDDDSDLNIAATAFTFGDILSKLW